MNNVTTPLRIWEIETFGRGGLVHYAYNLSDALAERGHDVTLVTTAAYELERRESPRANLRILKPIGHATSWIRRSLPGWAQRLALPAEAIRDAITVARLARRMRPDIIHLHCTNPAAVVYLACLRRAGRPVVYTAHVVTPHEPVPFGGPIYRRIHALGALIVAHSEFDRQRLLDEFPIPAERITVIPHGEYGFFQQCDAPPDRDAARQDLGIAPDEEVALFFGYIREYKGLDILLKAWPAVATARPKARLVVVGDPVQLSPARREELRTWATRVGATHRFEYIPFEEVSRYFVAADALVLPYRRISQSGVLFLALSLGVPIIATRVGPLPEMLRDGESARLIPPESPTALADGLVEVLGSPELRVRLATGGHRVANQHSWRPIAERTERAFAQLAGRDRETS